MDRSGEGFVVAAPRVIDRAFMLRTLEGLSSAVANEDAKRAIEPSRHIVPEYVAPLSEAESTKLVTA